MHLIGSERTKVFLYHLEFSSISSIAWEMDIVVALSDQEDVNNMYGVAEPGRDISSLKHPVEMMPPASPD